MDEATVAALAVWVDQVAQAGEDLRERAAAVAGSLWLSFNGWYDTALVAAIAREAAASSAVAQTAGVGLSTQYAANVVAVLRDTAVSIPPTGIPTIRGGADPVLVHHRPAEVYRRTIATGGTEDEALDAAVKRAQMLAETDVTLAQRQASNTQYRELGIRTYRRVLHPELSRTGVCGLCIAASTRIYRVEELLPIHGRCKCEPLPIDGDSDPGSRINEDDLKRIYADAGSTAARDLKKVRYEVHEHGELGPMLTRRGDSFRGPEDVPLENDPERARRMLDKVEPVLEALVARQRAGEDVTGPLAYQRELVGRLRRIVGN